MNEPTGVPAFDLPRATALLTAIADGADAARENRQSFEVSPNVTAELRSIAARLLSGEQDRERLDWLEAQGRALMCWNVSDDPEIEHWAAPMPPNNGWTIAQRDDEADDYRGTTARDAIDWAMKSESRAARSSEGRDNG